MNNVANWQRAHDLVLAVRSFSNNVASLLRFRDIYRKMVKTECNLCNFKDVLRMRFSRTIDTLGYR